MKLGTYFAAALFLFGSANALADDLLANQIHAQAPELPLSVIQKTLDYLESHDEIFKNSEYMAIVNFDAPSTQERFYLINLRTIEVSKIFASHGSGSSNPKDRKTASKFSNISGSHMSSLGFYRTFKKGEVNSQGYDGVYFKEGHWRIRLKGLSTTNSKAEDRDILVHAAGEVKVGSQMAPYVSQAYIDQYGYLGESQGCFALAPEITDAVVQQLEGAGLIYAYSTHSKGEDFVETESNR